jgi:RNA polymerase primary sigma factor
LTTFEDVVRVPVQLTVPPFKENGRGRAVGHQALLLVTPADEDDDRPNRLVCMRSSRMVVMERLVSDVPLGSSRFQAVLLAGRATGSDEMDADLAEEFLRAAEPPEHNDWKQTDDLTATYVRGAASRIREFRRAMVDQIRAVVRPPEARVDDTPTVLRDLLRLDPPPPPRSPGYPTIKSATGAVGPDGAWRIRVEVRLPERDDPWLLAPVLRFATRSGLGTQAEWAELTAESNCEVTPERHLRFATESRTAVFAGVSSVDSHPVAAEMAMAEVDLVRVKEKTQ